jgi:hypothetical protein
LVDEPQTFTYKDEKRKEQRDADDGEDEENLTSRENHCFGVAD